MLKNNNNNNNNKSNNYQAFIIIIFCGLHNLIKFDKGEYFLKSEIKLKLVDKYFKF